MPSLAIEDFRHGLDLRKSPLTAIPGSLQALQNAVLTQGGEIEKRRAFVQVATLPGTCFGLAAQGGALHTFGTAPPPAIDTSGLSVPLTYHQLQDAGTLTNVSDIETYKGKFWVSGVAGGSLRNWWDGTLRLVDITSPATHYARIFKSKMYRTWGTTLYFSAVDDPSTDADTAAKPGGGFIDLAAHDSEAEDLSGIEVYYSNLAVFARLATQIWDVDPDPSLNTLKQVIRTGSIAPNSIHQYGTGDVLFLSDSGIRSLRALNYTLAASVIDVGSPVDALVVPAIQADFAAAARARAAVQPVTGRFWLGLGNTVYVLSFFPGPKISAWSTFTIPFEVAQWAVLGQQVYALDTLNRVWLYGGASGNVFDDCQVVVRTPHFGVDKPSVLKKAQSVSAILSGAWQIRLGMVPDQPDLFETIANLSAVNAARIPVMGHGTHIGLELVHQAAGAATLSSLAVNYELTEKL